MKNNYRRLKAVLNLLDMNYFYTITYDKYDIKLQGHFNSSIIKKARDNKFKFQQADKNGYIEGNRGIIRIVLT